MREYKHNNRFYQLMNPVIETGANTVVAYLGMRKQ